MAIENLNCNDVVSLYGEWLMRMTGMTFSRDEVRRELSSELKKGNEELVENRINDLLLVKNNMLVDSKVMEGILMEM